MPVLMKVSLVSKNEEGETIEKATGFLYPGYENTVNSIQTDVMDFAEKLREKYGYVGV